MTLSAAPQRALARALAAAAVCATGALAAAPATRAADPVAAVLDRTTAVPAEVAGSTVRAQDRLRRAIGRRALLQSDPATGTPRIVARLDGFLTPASPQDPEAVALGYVRAHSDAFGLDAADLAGLRLTTRRDTPDGTVQLAWEQRAGGIPNVDGGLQAAVTAEGRLLNVRGGAIPDPPRAAPEPAVSAGAAYATALPGGVPAPATTGREAGTERATAFAGGGRASLVRYRDAGKDALGWRVLAPAGSSAFYDAIVDARSGTLQRRTNRVRFDGLIDHFNHNPVPEGGEYTPDDVLPSAWLDGGIGLSGPYVHAVSDVDDEIRLAGSAAPFALTRPPDDDDEVLPTSGAGGNRSFQHPLNMGPPAFCLPNCTWKSGTTAISDADRIANRAFSTQQLFWYVNRFRAHLAAAPIAFTAARGGFEDHDRILAQALDGARTGDPTRPDADHRNNASMLTLPDGYPGLMQVHLFALGPPNPPKLYDGAMDAGIVYHEYAHGLIDRLVTDAQGFGAMTGAQPGALAEGTSDFYALDFLDETQISDAEAAAGDLRLGHYLQASPATTGLSGTVRTQRVDCPVGPSTPPSDCPGTAGAGPGGYDLADFGRIYGVPEVHYDGEIWAQTLWSLRTALGPERMRSYLTEGLDLAPQDPTFLDLRNAIVQAAVNTPGSDDWATLWRVFAERGMGWSASTEGPNDLTPLPAGDVPPAPDDASGRGAVVGAIQDETGAPVPDAVVSVAGHDSGLGATSLQAATGGDGRYALAGVPAGRYPDLYVRKPGFQEATTGLDVSAGATTIVDFLPLWRDYASSSSGGSVFDFTGPNFGGDGCGPTAALDDDKRTVWSTTADAGPQDLVVDLGRSIDLREVRVDPRAGCGDAQEASLARYELAASDGPGQPFERIAGGVVGDPGARGYVTLPLDGDTAGRRLLRLRAIEPRSLDQNGDKPYMDVAELEVTGTPPPDPPAPAVTAVPSPAPAPAVTPLPSAAGPLAFLSGSRLRASRRGLFKVRVRFGDTAPAGTARLRVLLGKRTQLAAARLTVRPGRTVTKTMRLNATGRKRVKPGRSRRVRLEVRLPGGKTLTKMVKLSRAKRR